MSGSQSARQRSNPPLSSGLDCWKPGDVVDWAAVLQTEERERMLGSLTAVGPAKPVGYLLFRTIVDILGLRAAEVAADARSRGLSSMTLLPGRCRIKSGAFYVYNRAALRRLLHKSA